MRDELRAVRHAAHRLAVRPTLASSRAPRPRRKDAERGGRIDEDREDERRRSSSSAAARSGSTSEDLPGAAMIRYPSRDVVRVGEPELGAAAGTCGNSSWKRVFTATDVSWKRLLALAVHLRDGALRIVEGPRRCRPSAWCRRRSAPLGLLVLAGRLEVHRAQAVDEARLRDARRRLSASGRLARVVVADNAPGSSAAELLADALEEVLHRQIALAKASSCCAGGFTASSARVRRSLRPASRSPDRRGTTRRCRAPRSVPRARPWRPRRRRPKLRLVLHGAWRPCVPIGRSIA